MKVYLAGRYSRRDELLDYASRLQEAGFGVTSSWLLETNPLDTQMGDDSPEFYVQTAAQDILDILNADIFLFFAEDPKAGIPRGGRHVEFGFAIARGMKIYVVGPKENIFHYLDVVENYDTFEGAFTAMQFARVAV